MTHLPEGVWPALIADLQHGRIVWQLAAIALSFAIGWVIARIFRRLSRNQEASLVKRGMRPLSTIVAPLVAATLLVIAKPVLTASSGAGLITLAAVLLASFALVRAVFYLLRRVFARNGQVGGVLMAFEKAFALLVWLGVVIWVAGLWPYLHDFLAGTVIPLGRNKVSLLIMLQAGASVAVTLMLALWVGALLEERLMRIDTMHSSLRTVMAKTVRAMLILIAMLVSLSLVGMDLTVLSVFGGALGVGLGLGLQKIASSYVSGFVILLERTLALGDIVKVGEFQGQVSRINSRFTVLRGADGVEIVVPNDMLVSQVVQNFSLSDRKVRLTSMLTVDYDTDLQQLMPRLVETVSTIPRVIGDPAPQVLLLKFGLDGFELEISFWIADPENGRAGLMSAVNQAVWQQLQAMNARIAPQRRAIRVIPDPQDGSEPPMQKKVDKAPFLNDLP